MGKAEAKILSVTCYYILTTCIIIVTFAYSLVIDNVQKHRDIIASYHLCQSMRLQLDKQCGESSDRQLTALNLLSATLMFFQSYVPAIVFLFVAKCTWLQKLSINSPSRSRSRSKN